MGVTLYAIPACDTVKKARTFLAERGVEYAFHDYKKAGIDAATLGRWADAVGWETLLNRRGTTFRALGEADRSDLDRDKAIALMVRQPSLIKRPVVEGAGPLLVGFDAARYAERFAGPAAG